MAIKKVMVDGKPKFEVIVKVRDKSGKQVMRRRRWFDTEKEARRVEIEYRNSTYHNYKHCVQKWFDPPWNDMFIDEIKPSDVHKVIFEDCAAVSSHTRRGLLKIAKRIFNIAIEEGLMIRNPAVGIRVRCADANQAILNRNEIDVLLREAKRTEHRFFQHWTLALLTGMRSGELYSLRWTDVDLVTGKINISKAWTRYNGEGPTKTAKNRIYPISRECRRFLDEMKLKSAPDSEFVLPRLWEWDQGEQAKILKHFCGEIGITPVKFHDLRATFITQMLNNGVPLSKVMAIVGHSSLKTTQGYLRLSGKDIEGATEDLNIEVPRDEVMGDNVVSIRRK